MIRIAVVSRSAVSRAGLETLLRAQADFHVSTAADFAAAAASEPDVIILEWNQGDELPPDTPVPLVVLIDGPDPEWVRDAIRQGVRAVLPRNAAMNEIVASVQAAATGLVTLEPDTIDALTAPVTRAVQPGEEALTPREIEVLRLVAEGDGNKEIAWKLGISEHTVKFHVASLMAKLRASSRTEAVTIGVRRGVVPL